MSIRYSSRALGLGTVLLCAAAVLVNCGGDESTPVEEGVGDDDDNTGGKEATDGTGGGATDATGGGGGTGGGSGDAAGSTGEELVPVACSEDPAPDSGLVTDFSDIEAGTSWNSGQEKWGDTTFGGGTFHYHGEGDNLLATITDDGALALTGTVPASDYAGFGLWLTNCTDASDFDGITFTLGGDLGGAAVLFQLQMNEDYPIDTANAKGACKFTAEDSKWDECKNNEMKLGTPDPGVLEFEWAQFKGGLPVTPLNPKQLLGIQWQFQCEADEDCVIDITFDDVKFLETVTNPFTKKTTTGTGGASSGGAGGAGDQPEAAGGTPAEGGAGDEPEATGGTPAEGGAGGAEG